MSSDVRIADLPSTIHLFPIDRYILLPGTTLPLTVTLARSQEALDAAEAAGYVGVIQTRPAEERAESRFFAVGGLARIRRLERDAEGYHVLLEGVIRFRVREERTAGDGPAQAVVDYGEFEQDLRPVEEDLTGWNLEGLKNAFLELSRLQSGRGTTALESLDPHQLVRVMAQAVPLAAAEKQALLEARSFRELLELLFDLLSLNFLTTTPDPSPSSATN